MGIQRLQQLRAKDMACRAGGLACKGQRGSAKQLRDIPPVCGSRYIRYSGRYRSLDNFASVLVFCSDENYLHLFLLNRQGTAADFGLDFWSRGNTEAIPLCHVGGTASVPRIDC